MKKYEINFVVVKEYGKISIRLGNQVDSEGQETLIAVTPFEPKEGGTEHGLLAAIADTGVDEYSVGRALEELVAWSFQLGRQHPLPPELDVNELSGQDPRDDRAVEPDESGSATWHDISEHLGETADDYGK